MTVIAWDGKDLAGDRLADYGGTPLRTRKVARILTADGKEYLVGHAGHWNLCNAWLEWMRGKRKDQPNTTGEVFTAIMVDRGGAHLAGRGTLAHAGAH